MSMVQAFGDVSLLCIDMMFPEPHDLIPEDDASFESYLSEFFFQIRSFVLRYKKDCFKNPDQSRDASHSRIPPGLQLKFLQGLGTFFRRDCPAEHKAFT